MRRTHQDGKYLFYELNTRWWPRRQQYIGNLVCGVLYFNRHSKRHYCIPELSTGFPYISTMGEMIGSCEGDTSPSYSSVFKQITNPTWPFPLWKCALILSLFKYCFKAYTCEVFKCVYSSFFNPPF